MTKTLLDYYRIPIELQPPVPTADPSGDAGFFQFGGDTICFGRCKSGVSAKVDASPLPDASKEIRKSSEGMQLPFDISEVIDNLRRERYVAVLDGKKKRLMSNAAVREAYYALRGALPTSFRHSLQRMYLSDWKKLKFPRWPLEFAVDTLHKVQLRLAMEAKGVQKMPFVWFWPAGAPSCLILTHDVEAEPGRDFTPKLMDMDADHGLRASFQVIPEERYEVPADYLQEIRQRGFEVNVHDLNHDGRLFKEREEFLRRAKKINEYIKTFGARGFRAGAMYHNADWYDAFEFSYDMSIANVAHMEPQRGGCCTVMPYFIGDIVELPLTLTQDYSLLHMLQMDTIDLWRQEISLLKDRNGLISLISHPDYLIDHKNRAIYMALLAHIQEVVAREKIWAPLPGEVDRWWRARSQMRLVQKGNEWEIEGPDKSRACVAYAVLEDGRIEYEIEGVSVRA